MNGLYDLPHSVMTQRIDYETRWAEGWSEGSSIVPDNSAIQARVRELELFRNLFEGDYSAYLSNPGVVVNYHDVTATFLADALTARPPEFPDAPHSNRFINSLLDVLPNVIVDTVRYGVGIIRIVEGLYGLECTAPQPIYWFPVDDTTTVLFVRGDEVLQVIDEPGQVIERIYALHATRGEALGPLQFEQRFSYPGGWQAVGEETTGRVGSIIPIVREPNTGDWGRSLYQTITLPAMEINRVYNEAHALMQKQHPYIAPVADGTVNHALGSQQFTVQSARDAFREMLRHDIFVPPKGVASLEYLYWDGTIQNQLSYIATLEEQLYALTYIPAALYGLSSGTPPSGTSLSRQYFRTSAYVQQTQTTIAKALRKALLVGMAMDGAGDDAIRQFNDRLEIVWPNMFDDEDLVTEDDGEETDDERNEQADNDGDSEASPTDG